MDGDVFYCPMVRVSIWSTEYIILELQLDYLKGWLEFRVILFDKHDLKQGQFVL